MAIVASETPQDVYKAVQAGKKIVLVDVRTPAEFGSVRAQGAVSLPLDRVTPDAVRALIDGASVVHLICQGGVRSQKAADQLVAAGFTQVVNVTGGTKAWEAANLPVIRGRKAMPLERQVFLVAGLIVLIGMALGFGLKNHWYFLIPTFVGFGLTVAGSTGFCPMAILLAKMPWNQGAATTGSCCTAKM